MEDPIDNETTKRLQSTLAKCAAIDDFTEARLKNMKESFEDQQARFKSTMEHQIASRLAAKQNAVYRLNGEIKGSPDIDPPKQP